MVTCTWNLRCTARSAIGFGFLRIDAHGCEDTEVSTVSRLRSGLVRTAWSQLRAPHHLPSLHAQIVPCSADGFALRCAAGSVGAVHVRCTTVKCTLDVSIVDSEDCTVLLWGLRRCCLCHEQRTCATDQQVPTMCDILLNSHETGSLLTCSLQKYKRMLK